MAKVQVIKELVSRGRSEGMEKVTADLNKVADAQDNVARSGDNAAKVTDTAARRQLSAAAAYDRLLKTIDEGYRSQQLYARGQGVLDRAMEQGRISADEYARSIDLLNAKYLQPKASPEANDNDAALAYQRLMMSIDAAARAQNQFAEGQGILSRALEAGKIDAQEYARALELLKDRYTVVQGLDVMPAAAAQNMKLASHEVANLSAQVQDIGVSLAGGMNPFTVMLQQGSQISAMMGDRGLKSIFTGVGQALVSMINPTTAVLGGFTALYIGASYAYDAIKGQTKTVEDGLKEQERLLKIVERAYDDVAGAATKWQNASRAATVVETTKALADMKAQMDALSQRFLTGGTFAGGAMQSFLDPNDPIGNRSTTAVRDEFKAFSDPLKAFEASSKTADDVNRLVDAIGRIGEANPSLQTAAAKLLEMARGGGDAEKSMTSAAEGVAMLEAQLRVLSGTATQADLDLLKLANSAKDIETAAKLIEDLRRDGSRIGDDRAQAIGRVTDRLPKGATEDQVKEATRLAEENYRKEQAVRAAEKRAQEAERDANRAQRELSRDAQRIWDQTRTAAELYADEIERLNELLAKGAINQDTYARAALRSEEERKEREIQERYDTARKSGDGFWMAMEDYSRSVGTMAEQTADATLTMVSGMEDAFVDFVTTGKMSFSDFANSIISDMARIAARQAILNIFKPVAGGDFFSSFFGGSSGTVGNTTGAAMVGGSHAGSVGAHESSFVQMDDPERYRSVPRYHSGRDPYGLLAGERRAIIKDDEGVFTAGQMKAMGERMNASPVVNVNVETLPGTTADVRPRQNADGSVSLEVVMREVKAAIASDLEQRGPLAQKLERGYGLRRDLR